MYCFSEMFRYAVANKSDREEPTPVQLHGSISIIDLKGVWIVPLRSQINLQTRLGPLLEFQRRIVLARLVVSGGKTQNICQ